MQIFSDTRGQEFLTAPRHHADETNSRVWRDRTHLAHGHSPSSSIGVERQSTRQPLGTDDVVAGRSL
jgi:hypothetical protein